MDNRSLQDSGNMFGDFKSQVIALIRRYNSIVEVNEQLENSASTTESVLNSFKEEHELEMKASKEKIINLLSEISRASELGLSIKKNMKDVAKTDALERLNRKIDGKKFEENIVRDELYRMLSE